jgi:hypothetical protein
MLGKIALGLGLPGRPPLLTPKDYLDECFFNKCRMDCFHLPVIMEIDQPPLLDCGVMSNASSEVVK